MQPSEQKRQVGLADALRKTDPFKLDPKFVKDPVKLREQKKPTITAGEEHGPLTNDA